MESKSPYYDKVILFFVIHTHTHTFSLPFAITFSIWSQTLIRRGKNKHTKHVLHKTLSLFGWYIAHTKRVRVINHIKWMQNLNFNVTMCSSFYQHLCGGLGVCVCVYHFHQRANTTSLFSHPSESPSCHLLCYTTIFIWHFSHDCLSASSFFQSNTHTHTFAHIIVCWVYFVFFEYFMNKNAWLDFPFFRYKKMHIQKNLIVNSLSIVSRDHANTNQYINAN